MPETPTIPASNTTGKPAKNNGGAPKGNCNALRHGAYSTRTALWRSARKYRADLAPIGSDVGRLYAQLTEAVVACRSEVTIEDASAIDAACGWEFHLQLALKHLAASGLTAAVELEYSRMAATAREARHKLIAGLKLAKPDYGDGLTFPWPPQTPDDSELIPAAYTPPEGTGATQEGTTA